MKQNLFCGTDQWEIMKSDLPTKQNNWQKLFQKVRLKLSLAGETRWQLLSLLVFYTSFLLSRQPEVPCSISSPMKLCQGLKLLFRSNKCSTLEGEAYMICIAEVEDGDGATLRVSVEL